jgi:PrcB C-terminal
MSRRGVVPGVLAAVVLAGAGGGSCGDREVAVRTVGAGLQCGGTAEGVSVRRLGSGEDVQAALAAGLVASPAAPAMDFAEDVVVLVSAGQKPTAGYAIELASDKAPVKDGAAGVRVRFKGPAEGMMNAQVVTSPCLVVALPAKGLTGVGVLDGDKVVAKLSLK